MKLSLPTPAGWSRQQLAEGEMLQASNRPLELLVLPLEGAKLAPKQWLHASLRRRRRQPQVTPTQIRTGRLTTVTGWTALTVEAEIGTESRLVAYFAFLDLGATVIATCGERDAAGWRDEVIEILCRASLDFSADRITCLGELLGGPPPAVRADHAAFATESWRRSYSGGSVFLVPRMDPDCGWIRVAPGQTPEGTAAQQFDAFDPPELGITDEGEYFAIATARRAEPPRARAIVFGAESYTRIDAVTQSPDAFDMFLTATRALACEAILGYGTQRVRPYFYEPPPGWNGLPRTGSTVWISPTCARRHHILRVFDACPPRREAIVRMRRFEIVGAKFLATLPRGPAIYYTKDDLQVRVHAYSAALAGGEIRILDGSVSDAHYCYSLRIEHDPALLDESMRLLEDVVRTIVPLPSPSAEEPTRTDALSHWSE